MQVQSNGPVTGISLTEKQSLSYQSQSNLSKSLMLISMTLGLDQITKNCKFR